MRAVCVRHRSSTARLIALRSQPSTSSAAPPPAAVVEAAAAAAAAASSLDLHRSKAHATSCIGQAPGLFPSQDGRVIEMKILSALATSSHNCMQAAWRQRRRRQLKWAAAARDVVDSGPIHAPSTVPTNDQIYQGGRGPAATGGRGPYQASGLHVPICRGNKRAWCPGDVAHTKRSGDADLAPTCPTKGDVASRRLGDVAPTKGDEAPRHLGEVAFTKHPDTTSPLVGASSLAKGTWCPGDVAPTEGDVAPRRPGNMAPAKGPGDVVSGGRGPYQGGRGPAASPSSARRASVSCDDIDSLLSPSRTKDFCHRPTDRTAGRPSGARDIFDSATRRCCLLGTRRRRVRPASP